ncbi:hypothetical protein GQ85_03440 [Rhodococcus rhodochrous]|nr:hypothetical protein GQ85_03440 [Rhodococcus rhodochrous]
MNGEAYPLYDALVSADIVTDDPDGAAALLVDLLGLPTPRPNSFLEPEGHGFRAAWLRMQPSMRSAPTRIELIGARPRTEPHDYVEERIDAQGGRPVRTHATVLAGDVEAVMQHLERTGVRHRVTPASEDFDFPRVWIGVTADDPLGYRAEVDAGLWIEVVPTEKSGVSAADAGVGTGDGPGVRRIRARRFLVSDLDRAVQALGSNLGFAPPSMSTHEDGVSATYELRNPLSAALELCQPADESELGAFHREWGDGPHAIVLEVGDIDHMAAALGRHGVAGVASVNAVGERVLRLDSSGTLGVPFELVEARSRP